MCSLVAEPCSRSSPGNIFQNTPESKGNSAIDSQQGNDTYAEFGDSFCSLIDQCLTEINVISEQMVTMKESVEGSQEQKNPLKLHGENEDVPRNKCVSSGNEAEDWVFVPMLQCTQGSIIHEEEGWVLTTNMDCGIGEIDYLDMHEWPTITQAKNSKCKETAKLIRPSQKNKKKRKFKNVCISELGFYIQGCVEMHESAYYEDMEEIEKELVIFEKMIQDEGSDKSEMIQDFVMVESSSTPHEHDDNTTNKLSGIQSPRVTDINKADEIQGQNKLNVIKKKRRERKSKRDMTLSNDSDSFSDIDIHSSYLENNLSRLLQFEGLTPKDVRLRRKHKWRRIKAHKACKTKQLSPNNIRNKPHGHTVYVSSRISNNQAISSYLEYKGRQRNTKWKFFSGFPNLAALREARRELKASNPQYYNAAPAIGGPAARRQPPAAAVQRCVINAQNADRALEANLVNILINIQDRELTPEDYDLLLRLDDRVKPKTVAKSVVDALPTSIVTEELLNQDIGVCAVCLEPYHLEQIRKHLPCGHIFHSLCIDDWLSYSSRNCPLDGLAIDSA